MLQINSGIVIIACSINCNTNKGNTLRKPKREVVLLDKKHEVSNYRVQDREVLKTSKNPFSKLDRLRIDRVVFEWPGNHSCFDFAEP